MNNGHKKSDWHVPAYNIHFQKKQGRLRQYQERPENSLFHVINTHISFIGSVTLGSYNYSTYTINVCVYIEYGEQGSLESRIFETCINQQSN